MANKVRLDLMVNERTKTFLQRFAAEQGVSMSEMVDQLIVEHLMGGMQSADYDLASAAIDALRIADLKEEVRRAIANGDVKEFGEYCREYAQDPSAPCPAILYRHAGDFYAEIVVDCLIDELHDDVVSTYSGDQGILSTVDAYLEWYEDDDGTPRIMGLMIVPKGLSPEMCNEPYDWEAPASWPKDIPEPQP